MYYFYLGTMLLPVTPKAVTFSYGSQNKTYTLIDDGEINILKKSALCDISFDFLLPAHNYAFKSSVNLGQQTYLELLKKLKEDKKPFQFIIVRAGNGSLMNLRTFTNVKAALESYIVTESSDNGLDMLVSVKLKEFRPYGTKRVKVNGTTGTIESKRDTSNAPKPANNKVVKVKGDDTMWKMTKLNYGSGDNWKQVAEYNGIKNPNELGNLTELILPVLGVQ